MAMFDHQPGAVMFKRAPRNFAPGRGDAGIFSGHLDAVKKPLVAVEQQYQPAFQRRGVRAENGHHRAG
jgi:hypothetical protein